MKYEIVKDGLGNDCITGTTDDGAVLWIPADPSNSDYQRYLNPEKDEAAKII
jgi:hypothetical protein